MNKSSLLKLERSHWDWANSILYDMCKNNLTHKKEDIALAKMWLIGRSYSAAIERGAGEHVKSSVDFYAEKVAPMLVSSDIDKWINKLNKIGRITDSNYEITDKSKRSLVSKYLHFHSPETVFIYDSIANKSIRVLLSKEKTNFNYIKGYDNAYSLFVVRCLYLRDKVIEPKIGKTVSPRFIDKVLLSPINEKL
jgi:formylmethanofuran dehydrogenase subunit E-like metal-binding protein